jgi:replicative DNA helicase
LSGVATGFDKLDKITSGWQPSDLIIIAARPAIKPHLYYRWLEIY